MSSPPGRKPKPAKLHLLHGNKHKVKDNTPILDSQIPDMPDFLSEEAIEEWNIMAPELDAVGLLSTIDKAALSAYCQAYGRWRKVEKLLNQTGVVYKKKVKNKETGEMEDTGELLTNPLLWIANRAMEQMRQFSTEFGMTPSSRSRVAVRDIKKSVNPYEEWKKGKKK